MYLADLMDLLAGSDRSDGGCLRGGGAGGTAELMDLADLLVGSDRSDGGLAVSLSWGGRGGLGFKFVIVAMRAF